MTFDLHLFSQFEWGQTSVRASTTTECITKSTLQLHSERSLQSKSSIQTYLQLHPPPTSYILSSNTSFLKFMLFYFILLK
jgi:hypothetical protein